MHKIHIIIKTYHFSSLSQNFIMMVYMILLGQLSIIPTNNRGLLCTESEYKFDVLHETWRERSGDCIFLPLTESVSCLLWEDRIDMVVSAFLPLLTSSYGRLSGRKFSANDFRACAQSIQLASRHVTRQRGHAAIGAGIKLVGIHKLKGFS